MASLCDFTYGDVVYKINKKKLIDIGIVLTNYEDLSTDIQSDDSDYLEEGQIRVHWHPNGAKKVLPKEQLYLCDRVLYNGTFVKRMVEGQNTQLGYCKRIEVTVDVQVVGTKYVLTNVPSTDLEPLQEFGGYNAMVFKDSCLGVVKKVTSELTLRFSDGSRCIISSKNVGLRRKKNASEFKNYYSFYTGEQLYTSFNFKNAKWLQLNKMLKDFIKTPRRTIMAIVEDVKILSLDIEWERKAYIAENLEGKSSKKSEKNKVTGKDLKSLKSVGRYKYADLGDRNYLIMKDEYDIISHHEWKKRIAEHFSSERDSQIPCSNDEKDNSSEDKKFVGEKRDVMSGEEQVNSVEDQVKSVENQVKSEEEQVKSEEDQVKSEEEQMKSEEEHVKPEERKKSSDKPFSKNHSKLYSLPSIAKKKRIPHYSTKTKKNIDKIWSHAIRHVRKDPLVPKAGDKLLTEVLVTKRRANVVWQDGSLENGIPSNSLFYVDRYDMDRRQFFPGNFVIDSAGCCPHEYGVVKNVNHIARTALVTWFKTDYTGKSTQPEVISDQVMSVYDIIEHPDFDFDPTERVVRLDKSENSDLYFNAGQVIDSLPSGKVEVLCVDGKTSLCYPHELYSLNKYQEVFFPFSDDESNCEDDAKSDDSWETTSEKCFLEDEVTELPRVAFYRFMLSKFEDVQMEWLADIEKIQTKLADLEVVTRNTAMQACALRTWIIEIYKDCKSMEKQLGTTYFNELDVKALVKRLKQHDYVPHLADQIFHSSQEPNNSPRESLNNNCDGNPQSTTPTIPQTIVSSSGDEDCQPPTFPVNSARDLINICQQLCASLKLWVQKVHEERKLRFENPQSDTSAELLSEETTPLSSDESTNKPDLTEVDIDERVPLKELTTLLTNSEGDSSEVKGVFSMLPSVLDTHRFKVSLFQPVEPSAFIRTVRKEMKLLVSSLPEGIIVKGFEDRIDLFSVLIKGPRNTPYEDGLFFFDLQLPPDYPKSPPLCHYIAYCTEKLNPNLYEDGTVCVSLLGTWSGKGVEMWNPETSNLLQVIISIQGLILVSEPYYNEAGYEKKQGTKLGMEKSQSYNEMVVLKLVQAMTKLLTSHPEVFHEEVEDHFKTQSSKFINRIEKWIEISDSWKTTHPASSTSPTKTKKVQSLDLSLPEFPLIPASKGFCIALRKALLDFKNTLASTLPHS